MPSPPDQPPSIIGLPCPFYTPSRHALCRIRTKPAAQGTMALRCHTLRAEFQNEAPLGVLPLAPAELEAAAAGEGEAQEQGAVAAVLAATAAGEEEQGQLEQEQEQEQEEGQMEQGQEEEEEEEEQEEEQEEDEEEDSVHKQVRVELMRRVAVETAGRAARRRVQLVEQAFMGHGLWEWEFVLTRDFNEAITQAVNIFMAGVEPLGGGVDVAEGRAELERAAFNMWEGIRRVNSARTAEATLAAQQAMPMELGAQWDSHHSSGPRSCSRGLGQGLLIERLLRLREGRGPGSFLKGGGMLSGIMTGGGGGHVRSRSTSNCGSGSGGSSNNNDTSHTRSRSACSIEALTQYCGELRVSGAAPTRV